MGTKLLWTGLTVTFLFYLFPSIMRYTSIIGVIIMIIGVLLLWTGREK